MEATALETLFQFFKALANEERLKIVGLLASDARTLPELAAALGLREQAVARHLSTLTQVGLLAAQPTDSGIRYALDVKALERLSRELLAPIKEAEQTMLGADDDTKVLRTFFKGDRLQSVPVNPGKRRVVLTWLAGRFELDRRYAESEVNAILQQHFDDYATLRRYLVDYGFMARDHGIYRRAPSPTP